MEVKILNKIMRWVAEDPTMVTIIKGKYLNDDIWRYCIEQEPSLFEEMRDPSYEFITSIVKHNGFLISTVFNKWPEKVDKKLVYHAVKNAPMTIVTIPPEYLDWTIKEMAFDKEPKLMKHFAHIRYGYVDKRIEEDPTIIQYVEATEDQICKALKISPAVAVYVKNFTPKMRALIKELYPTAYPLLFPQVVENEDDVTQP